MPAAVRHVWQRALCVVTAMHWISCFWQPQLQRARWLPALTLQARMRSVLDKWSPAHWNPFSWAEMHWALKRRFISTGLGIVSGITYPSGHTRLLILSVVSRERSQKTGHYIVTWVGIVIPFLFTWIHLFMIHLGNLQKKYWLPTIIFLVTSCVQRLRTFGKTLRHIPWLERQQAQISYWCLIPLLVWI